MERYYGNSYQGRRLAQTDHYVNVWCEICGGPHYSQECPDSSGYSTDYYGRRNWSVWFMIDKDIQAIMDEVPITVTEGEAQVPPLGMSSDLDLIGDEFYTDSLQAHAIPRDTLRLSYPPSVYTPWSCGPEPIEDDFFSDDHKAEVEESSDDTVGYGPGKYSEPDLIEPIFENLKFLGDELNSSNTFDTLRLFFKYNVIQDLESEDECCEEELHEFEEEMVEKAQVPSWEDEFSDELKDLPTPMEEEFNPLGDLKLLEDLLHQEPSVGMEEEVQADEVTKEPREELVSDPPRCTRKSKKKRPVDEAEGKKPQQQKAPRGREERMRIGPN
ncbi:hypothetical protein L1987_15201 [Smallanthus sonchifolius]|uniref:Uncharacterized protein n=1 Tax=Smallanthus sonchifolius TaxID=185202 RepID=A0ACB9J6Y8_9ASTR|nr:hypothetical protein L1987_15201 [Smallanthus sonchifolius]